MLQLNQVAPRVTQERLSRRGNAPRFAYVDSLPPQCRAGGVQVGDDHREVVAVRGSRRSNDEVDLLAADVDPRPVEGKVGSIRTFGQTELLQVKGTRRADVADRDVYVVDAQRSNGKAHR